MSSKKNCARRDRIKDKHKNDLFQTHKDQNQKPSTPINRHRTQNELTTQKIAVVYFKNVKIEETFRSQDQKLVETSIL